MAFGENLTRSRKENLQQTHLAIAQLFGRACDIDLTGGRIKHHIAKGLGIVRHPAKTAHHGTDPGLKLGKIERFGDVVIRPKVEQTHPVGHLGTGRQHNDRRRVILVTVAAQELPPVAVGQHNIKQNHIVSHGAHAGLGIGEAVGKIGHVALQRQTVAQRLSKLEIIFDQQKPHFGDGPLHVTGW